MGSRFLCRLVADCSGRMFGFHCSCHKKQENPTLDTTAVCINSGVGPYIAATTIIPLVNDTLVFVAITWRLTRNSYDVYTISSGIRTVIFGDYLLVFSKVLLQDAQIYYLLAFPLLYLMFKSTHRLLQTGPSLPRIPYQ